jgi:hypothetical protein
VNTSLERATAAAGLAVGALLLVRPQPVLDRVAPQYPRDQQWVVRLLGARLVVQHAAVLTAPRRWLVRAGATVDLLHAATMVPLLDSARYGRAARVSGALAAAYGVAGWVSPPAEG